MSKGEGKRRQSPGADSVRTFVCIEIPDSIKQRLEELENDLRSIDAQVSWTKPSNVHVTLKFLGGVPKDKIDAVGDAAENAASLTAPLELEVGGAGCFPSPRNPRVLWVGLTKLPDGLVRLHASLDQELASIGFERERRRFAPHLTIGRLRSPHNGGELARKLMEIGFEPETFTARQIVVMRSELKPTGSIYTPLRVVSLES